MSKKTEPKRVHIINPVGGSTASDVSANVMMTEGYLCLCDGTTSPPPDYNNESVSLINRAANSSQPTDDEFDQSDHFAYAGTDNKWAYNGSLLVNHEVNPATNNRLWVRAIYRQGMNTTDDFDDTQYKGKTVNQCAPVRIDAPTGMSQATTPSALQRMADVDPYDRRGQWLFYKNLSAALLFEGNRLMYHGQPLRATVLALATSDVGWRYSLPTTRHYYRPIGDIAPAGNEYFFYDGLPRSCVAIWQGARKSATCLISQSRERPDVVHIDPTKDIYMQVNYPMDSLHYRSGGFDLAVKVIS